MMKLDMENTYYLVEYQQKLNELYDNTVACPGSGCLIWLGATSGDPTTGKTGRGYARTRWRGRKWQVSRLVVWLAKRLRGEKLWDWQQVDHKCRNRLCIRLEHLEPVTHKENTKRRDKAKK